MSQTLSKGYKLPETGDRSWWDDIAFDIVRVNGHEHDGVDSEKIKSFNLNKSATLISSTNWGSDIGGNTFEQTIALPAGYEFDTTNISIRLASTGEIIYAKIIKDTDSSFIITVNDNTLELVALYV